ncbi:MAG: RNA polymerase sigma factor [Candidatus Omnitrophota bacterium]
MLKNEGKMVDAEIQLISKVKAGDKDAFDGLVSLHKRKAFGLCYSIVGNVEDAKDILQDGFIKAYENIDRFRGDSSFYTWLYRILVNISWDHLRKKKGKKMVHLDEGMSVAGNPVDSVFNKELKDVLDSAIRLLSERQHICFVMKHVNGMKIDEIARILHCSASTVKIHLFRAVRNLQKLLDGYL